MAACMAAIMGCLALAGCQPSRTCAAGLSAEFTVTVDQSAGPEPSLQYCAAGRCSPRPAAGPIPPSQVDPHDEHTAVVRYLGRGEWIVSPRSDGSTPTTVTLRLYRDGRLVQSSTAHLVWPHQDPCAASGPPNPHVTLRG